MTSERREMVRMARLLSNAAADDGSFDLEFWHRVGVEGRFAAAWEMTAEVAALRGEDAWQPRLQRSVVRLLRHPGH